MTTYKFLPAKSNVWMCLESGFIDHVSLVTWCTFLFLRLSSNFCSKVGHCVKCNCEIQDSILSF